MTIDLHSRWILTLWTVKVTFTIFKIYYWDQCFIDAVNRSQLHTSSHLPIPPPWIRIEQIIWADCMNIHLPYDRDFDGACRIIGDMGLWSRCLTPLSKNISVISWRLALLMEETGEITDLTRVTDKLYHIMLYRIHLAWAGFELTKLVVLGTDCIGNCKSNHHTITTTTAPRSYPTYRILVQTRQYYFCLKLN